MGIKNLKPWIVLLGLTLSFVYSQDVGLFAYEVIEVKDGGTISGKVTLLGDVPERAPIDINRDKEVCATHPKLSENLIVSESKGIKNVIVSIIGIEKGKKIEIPSENPVLDQKDCEFKPHVICITAGTTIDVLNSDPIIHNVHTYPEENTAINMAQPPSLKKILLTTEFGEEDPVKIACDYHGWMSAWLGIFEHPYFAVTGDDGVFTLTDVPPGSYEVKAWQEELGELVKLASVKAGEKTALDFEFKVEE